MDHVGASAKYDEVLISADYPQNKETQFFAEYWLPKYPMHIIRQGIVKVKISGRDQTPPVIDNIQFRGDNTIEAKVTDGGSIKSVTAKMIRQYELEKVINVQLKDDGTDGDKTANDHIYSMHIPDQKFATYRIVVEAEDASGNRSGREGNGIFVGH
jgi:hypothetical protein